MNEDHHVLSGSLHIDLKDQVSGSSNFFLKIPDCSEKDVMRAAHTIAQHKIESLSTPSTNWNSVSCFVVGNQEFASDGTRFIVKDILSSSESNRSDESSKPIKEEVVMSELTRSELQSHLDANKAEVNAIASSMKKDMAEWREQMRSDLRDVTEAINKQNSTLDKHFHSQEVKLTSSLELQSSKFDLALTNAKLDIIKWVLGLPSLAFVIYKIYGAIANIPTP